MSGSHLVLGGSQGIGFAYAKWWARRGASLTIVARTASVLENARVQLLENGAAAITIVAGDLLDPHFTKDVLPDLAAPQLHWTSVFVSGASPPAGDADTLSVEKLDEAYRICLLYPTSVLLGLVARGVTCDRIVVVSSASVDDARKESPFYLSSVLRAAQPALLAPIAARMHAELHILKPNVIVTPLSVRYALTLNPTQDVSDTLEQHLGERPLRADDFIAQTMAGLSQREA